MPRRNLFAAVLLGAALLTGGTGLKAQIYGPHVANSFHDTSMLKPPAGQKVAIIVFEDLECPACAHAHPIELQAAARYHVPIVRYDFPLKMHVWSFDGAVFARYLQDKVNPNLADQYRTAVFANQTGIASKDDLMNFTRKFMQQHGQMMPFAVDPSGQLANEVRHDYSVGERLNVTKTPTIVVATPTKWQAISGNDPNDVQSNDPENLFPVIEAALAETKTAEPATRQAPHHTAHHATR